MDKILLRYFSPRAERTHIDFSISLLVFFLILFLLRIKGFSIAYINTSFADQTYHSFEMYGRNLYNILIPHIQNLVSIYPIHFLILTSITFLLSLNLYSFHKKQKLSVASNYILTSFVALGLYLFLATGMNLNQLIAISSSKYAYLGSNLIENWIVFGYAWISFFYTLFVYLISSKKSEAQPDRKLDLSVFIGFGVSFILIFLLPYIWDLFSSQTSGVDDPKMVQDKILALYKIASIFTHLISFIIPVSLYFYIKKNLEIKPFIVQILGVFLIIALVSTIMVYISLSINSIVEMRGSATWFKLANSLMLSVLICVSIIEVLIIGYSFLSNKEIDRGEGVFRNRFLTVLFDYTGDISSREYRAALIYIMNMSAIAIICSFIPFLRTYLLSSNILQLLGLPLLGYSLFIINYKRARTSGANNIWSLLCGASFLIIIFIATLFIDESGNVERDLFYGLLATLLLYAVQIYFLSRDSDFDFSHDELSLDDNGYSSTTYLLRIFNLSLISVGINILFSILSSSGSYYGTYTFLNFIKLSIALVILIYSLVYLVRRVRNAGISVIYIPIYIVSLLLLVGFFIFAISDFRYSEESSLGVIIVTLISLYPIAWSIFVLAPTKARIK